MCRELLDLGMTLARSTATRAAADIAAPPPTTPIPCSAAAALERAEQAARHRAPDYGRLFTHLSRSIRQTMLLEAHIIEGRTRNATTPVPANDTTLRDIDRDTPTRETMRSDAPSRDMPRRDTLERLDCTLPLTPAANLPVEHRQEPTAQAPAATHRPAGHHPPDTRPTNPAEHGNPPNTHPPNRPDTT